MPRPEEEKVTVGRLEGAQEGLRWIERETYQSQPGEGNGCELSSGNDDVDVESNDESEENTEDLKRERVRERERERDQRSLERERGTHDSDGRSDEAGEESVEEESRELEDTIDDSPGAVPRVERIGLSEDVFERQLNVLVQRLLVTKLHVDSDGHLLKREER